MFYKSLEVKKFLEGNMKKLLAIFMASLLTLTATLPAHAHGGRTDKNGCHNDNKKGGRHCH